MLKQLKNWYNGLYRVKLRNLEKRVESLKIEQSDAIKKEKEINNAPSEAIHYIESHYEWEIIVCKEYIEKLRTDDLETKMRRRYLELPDKEKDNCSWKVFRETEYDSKMWILTEKGQCEVNRKLMNHRKKTAKFWITTVVGPLVSMLVGVLGAIIGVFASI